jgi:hypothetical protein
MEQNKIKVDEKNLGFCLFHVLIMCLGCNHTNMNHSKCNQCLVFHV